MGFITVALSVVAAVIYAGLAIMSFINGGLSKRSILFSLFMFAGAGWAIQTFLDVGSYDLFLMMTRLIYTTFSLIFYLFLLFSLTFLNLSNKQFTMVAGLGLVMWATTALFTWLVPGKYVIEDVTIHANGYIDGISYGMIGMLVGTLMPSIPCIVLGLIAQTRARKQTMTVTGKRILKTVLICSYVFVSFVMIFNLGFSTVHEAHWIGPMSILLVGFAFYGSVVKHADDEF